jgi:hypothetical protein
MNEASVSFAGNLTDDPEVRHTESGIARAMLRVAVSGRREQEASFFTVVVWRDQAEHAAQSLSKGSRVVIVDLVTVPCHESALLSSGDFGSSVRRRGGNQDGDAPPGPAGIEVGWRLAFGGYGEQGGRVVVVGAVVVVDVVVVGHGPVVVEGVVVVVVDGVVVVVAEVLVGGGEVVVDGLGAARVVEGAGPGCLAVEDPPAVVGPGRGDGPEGGAAAAPGGLAVMAGPTATPPS